MSSRVNRATNAKETLEILENGFYINKKGKKIAIKDFVKYSISNSVLYYPEQFQSLENLRKEVIKQSQYKTTFEILNCTTLNAASRLIAEKKYKNVCGLNFASAKNPGGGFLKGSNAQEESLARASGLYPCLIKQKEYYEINKQYRSALYTDNIIYAPEVIVFRDDQDDLLDTPFFLSIITAPAVNAGAVINKEKQNISKIKPTMINRLEKVLMIAAVQGVDALILGAWGCGVFKNDPKDVAGYFYKLLVEDNRFQSIFKKVVFAILDRTKDGSIIRPFEIFSTL